MSHSTLDWLLPGGKVTGSRSPVWRVQIPVLHAANREAEAAVQWITFKADTQTDAGVPSHSRNSAKILATFSTASRKPQDVELSPLVERFSQPLLTGALGW